MVPVCDFQLEEQSAEIADSRERGKLFTFDHSYWSVRKGDKHYASQQQVSLGHHLVITTLTDKVQIKMDLLLIAFHDLS